jgi:hypothetical protein
MPGPAALELASAQEGEQSGDAGRQEDRTGDAVGQACATVFVLAIVPSVLMFV